MRRYAEPREEPVPGGLPVRALLGALLALGLLAAPARAADGFAAAPQAAQVKAAFIYNFVKFVEWPAASLGAGDSPLVVGSLGHDAVSEALAASPWEPIGGHPVVVRRIEDEAGCEACHVLYVSPSRTGRLSELLAKLSTRPVLTVGDSEGFLTEGGFIRFFLERGKVRFSICRERARRAGLRLPAGLLQVAQIAECQ